MALHRAHALLESLAAEPRPLTAGHLPFVGADATAGSEDELQTVVAGAQENCDLPRVIRESRFFHNLFSRSRSGETSRSMPAELEQFLNDTRGVWENSWIRFPESRLSRYALQVLQADLEVQGQDGIRERSDSQRFRFRENGEPWLRVPMSYALKLALADVLGTQRFRARPPAGHLPGLASRNGRCARIGSSDSASAIST